MKFGRDPRVVSITLIGKQIMAVLNFPSKQRVTIQRECLVLGVTDAEKGVILIQPEE